jgi:hypothetical protein
MKNTTKVYFWTQASSLAELLECMVMGGVVWIPRMLEKSSPPSAWIWSQLFPDVKEDE